MVITKEQFLKVTKCEILCSGQTTNDDTLQVSNDAIINGMATIILNPDAFEAPTMQTKDFVYW